MTTIAGYGANLSEDQILGHLAWYTVSEPAVTHTDFKALLKDNGLDDSIAPSKPRPGDAFKRACRHSELKKVSLGVNNYVNITFRPVARSAADVERVLVMEEVDEKGRQLDYHQLSRLKLDRKASTVQVISATPKADLVTLMDEALEQFQENFKFALRHLDSQVIRRSVREQLDGMRATAVRRGIYFVPKKAVQQLEGLEVVLTKIGSELHGLPLVDTSKQREMITAAFQHEIHEEANTLVGKFSTLLLEGKKMKNDTFAVYLNRKKELKARRDDYAALVGDQLEIANVEIDLLDKQLVKYLDRGMVK